MRRPTQHSTRGGWLSSRRRLDPQWRSAARTGSRLFPDSDNFEQINVSACVKSPLQKADALATSRKWAAGKVSAKRFRETRASKQNSFCAREIPVGHSCLRCPKIPKRIKTVRYV